MGDTLGRKPKEQNGQLTEFELEVMSILWASDGATATEVHQNLSEDRELAYTTVSTILRVLEKKGVVVPEKVGRQHLYKPVVSKEEHQSQSLDNLLNKVFDGTAPSLVQRLVEDKKISKQEIDDIRSILKDLES